MKKKNQKITLAVIMIIIVSYLGAGFALRNKSPLWCYLSLGAFDVQVQPIVRDEKFGAMELTNMPSSRNAYGCNDGIFGFLD